MAHVHDRVEGVSLLTKFRYTVTKCLGSSAGAGALRNGWVLQAVHRGGVGSGAWETMGVDRHGDGVQ